MKEPRKSLLTVCRCAWPLILAGILPGLLLVAPGVAQTTEIKSTADVEVPTVEELSDLGLQVVDGRIELTLEDAITIAVRRNLTLVVERYRRSQVIQGIQEAVGIFDLNIDGTVGIGENSSPTTSELEEALVLVNDNAIFNVDVTQLTPYGGLFAVAYHNDRFESSNANVVPNPQFGSDFDLTFTQPLLRNFGRLATKEQILIARNDAAISFEDFQFQVEAVVQEVSDRYWTMVEARDQLAVAEESLSLAEELHEMNRIQVEVGTLAPLEMVQSEAGVATREEEIIRRQADVEDGADALRRLLNIDRLALWDVGIVPVTDPEVPHTPIDFDEAIAIALENRPDVKSQRLLIDIRRIQTEAARNEKLPRLDFSATYGYNGVGGDRLGANGDPINGDYFDALEQVLDREFDGWQVGLTFAYPLQNRTARARYARAELAFDESNVQLRNLQQGVVADVRQTARAVETAAKQIESAEVSTRLARKNLEAEQKRYENGLSTSFQVLQIQEDLSQAQSRQVTAITAYRRALTAYQRAIGRLLDAHDIELIRDGGEGEVKAAAEAEAPVEGEAEVVE